jgi:hypothetical protein
MFNPRAYRRWKATVRNCSAGAHAEWREPGARVGEGGEWHPVVHRQEPEPGLLVPAGGRACDFPGVTRTCSGIGMPTGARWDPIAFIEYCGRATQGSEEERIAQEVQRAEWQLLFAWCAK